MAKFKEGDRVRCVVPDRYRGQIFGIGDTALVIEHKPRCALFVVEGDGIMHEDKWELATPSPIPDTVTIGGVEYVRKPEREFKYGDWVKTHDKKTVGFVLGHNYNKVACAFNDGEISWYSAHELTYISDATIPE